MKTQLLKSIVVLSVSFFSGTLVADDTEIYTGPNGNATVRPNIVFIIDTSGSMATDVSTAPAFDPGTTYSGICDPNRIYYTSGKAPSCAANSTAGWFVATQNKCAASLAPLKNTGRYQDRLAMWNSGSKAWKIFSSKTTNVPVECQKDAGIDGDGVNTTALWAAQSTAGPWTTDSAKQLNWSATGSSYTLWDSNYLNYLAFAQTAVKISRLDMVKSVLNNLIANTQNINMAIVRFDGNGTSSSNKGGYVLAPMTPLTDANRASLQTQVSALSTGGWTPLAETLYEVTRYYRGEGIQFGLNTTPGINHVDSYSGTTYISPIQYQCQKNFIVLFTDGDPTYDTDADSLITALPAFSAATGAASCSGDCLDELAQYLNKRDQRADLNDIQNVVTYTVGFTAGMSSGGLTLLNETANKGGGKYFPTSDVASLTDAFSSIVTEILAVNTTFTAPAVSVNAFNRNTHYDQLYFALFRPSSFPYWDGNVKRYRIGQDPTGATAILDSTNANAIDPNTAFFKQGAVSWWTNSTTPDSDNVALGGASANMPLPRNVYTYLGTTGVLTNADNKLHEDNALITAAMLGVTSYTDPVAQRTKVLQWARGVDLLDDNMNGSTTDARQQMGDPLHTEPVLVTYGKDASGNPDLTLYATTNEGYLHAIDTSTGIEKFSFMPQELLSNIDKLLEGAASNTHPNGLDGPLSSWVYDKNNDGTITPGSDHVYLYAAMRRGGRNIYALDVTNRSAPVLMWTIKGGPGGTAGFDELGETWSKATHTRVKWNGAARDVLIFGGGYNDGQEVNGPHVVDNTGRAVYMVDASTGALLWKAGPSGSGADLVLAGMTNSIPSEVRLIDVDSNGFVDLMYVGDMAGQLWRFDINDNNAGATNFATAGLLASLGGTAIADNRRFYYPPSVSMSTTLDYFNIAIGSGYRGHPLATDTHDAFFVLRDKNIHGPAKDTTGAPTYTALKLTDLYDATADAVQSATAATAAAAATALKNSNGFYINMNHASTWEGEKVLAQALTMDSTIYFTTFTPVATASNACAPSQGTARAYIISAEQGAAMADVNGDGVIDGNDRSTTLVRGGIPPRPTVVITASGGAVVVATSILNSKMPTNNPRRSSWKRNVAN